MARLKSRINPQLSRLISRLIVLSTCVLNLQIPSNGPLCEVLSTLGTAKKWSSVRKLKWSSQWSRTKHNKEEICRDQESLVPWLKWSPDWSGPEVKFYCNKLTKYGKWVYLLLIFLYQTFQCFRKRINRWLPKHPAVTLLFHFMWNSYTSVFMR